MTLEQWQALEQREREALFDLWSFDGFTTTWNICPPRADDRTFRIVAQVLRKLERKKLVHRDRVRVDSETPADAVWWRLEEATQKFMDDRAGIGREDADP